MSLVSGPGRAAGMASMPDEMHLFVDKHVRYIQSLDTRKDELEYWLTEHLRLNGLYWGLTALHLLGHPDALPRTTILDFVFSCMHDNGGLGAAPGHDAHMLYTVSGVQILATLDAFGDLEDRIPGGRLKIGKFIADLQDRETGTFAGDEWGEQDTRFLYGALNALSLMGLLELVDVEKAAQYVDSCANFDGGYGTSPGAESHSGQVFTCVGALTIAGRLDLVNQEKLGAWLSERQLKNGGLNGRPEKKEDVCYSWWVMSSMAMLDKLHWIDGQKLTNFILQCQDPELGGLADLKSVIEQAKILLLTKNEGNLLQDFIWQAEHLGSNSASLPNAPVDKDTAKQHGNEALDGLRTLGTLIISNGQFRKLLSDATVLLRDMAGDAAQNTANKIKPSEDRLNRLDEPAEDNTWHDTSDLNRENLRNQAKNSLPFGNKNKDEAKSDLKEHAKDINQAANPDGSRDPQHTAELGAHEGQTGQSTGINARGALETAKQKVDANTSEEDKNMARARRDQMNNYLKGKMPEERREQTIWRLKKMVVEIQGHQDYQRAIETLLSLAEQYSGHGKNLGQQGKGSVQGAHQNDALTTAEADLKTLLERFANNTSFDDLIESINQVYKDADQDPELKNWFTRINHFIRKTLQQQGFILEDRSNEEWNQIYDDGHRLLRGRYRGHTDRIADEFKFIGEQFDADPQNKQFAQSVNKLFLDLGQDENGQTVFKPHLLKDLSDVILPSIFENVRYVPIPRIEYSDSMVDAVVENLVIEGDNLAPNSLEFGSDNYWRWGRKSISSKNKNKVMLSVSGVQMDLRDVSYYIKRKQGFPSITDKGVMDIFMGGSGFSFKVEMETADKARENHAQTHFFKVTKVESDIKNLQIKMKKSNHKLLFNMFKPLLLKVMRPVIQKVLEKQIKDSANQLDGILFDIKTEADRAEAEAKRNPDPQNLQNMYQRYASAMQHRVMQGKQKKEQVKEKASDTQVNMAVTQHDSIFKNISLPGGISSKATEYKELAAKGERWESPIFSIGSAKETSSLPQVGKVTRKPHGRAGGYGSPGDESRGLGASQGLNPSANQYDSQYSNAGGLGAGQGLTSGQGLTGGSGLTGGQGLTGGSGLTGGQGLTGGSGLAGGQGLTGGVPSTTGGSHGFGTQVDDAFNTSGTGAPVGSSGLGSSGLDSTGLNNPAATTTGSTTHPTGAPASGEFNTTFGDQNPVFQGRA